MVFRFAWIYFVANIGLSQSMNPSDTLWVWNIEGTNVYSEPNQSSEILASLTISDRVILIQEFQGKKTSVESISGLTILGNWLYVKSKDRIGYVAGTDLYDIPLNLLDHKPTREKVLGNKLGFSTYVDTVNYDDKNFAVKHEITEYENGSYDYSYDDGCFDHVHIIRHQSFNFIFHYMMHQHSVFREDKKMNGLWEWPRLLKQTERAWVFEGTEATGLIEISILPDNSIRLYSYDCT